MEGNLELILKYNKWLDKKLQGKPAPIQTLQRRTLHTALAVASTIRDIPFEKVSVALYFICQDLKTEKFTRLFESQLELAGANEDMFIKGLHKFYNEVSLMIKNEDLYQEFFEFLSLCADVRYNHGRDDIGNSVINCYQSLLLQQTEYLRPNKFDFSEVVCGRTTSGEIMTIRDTHPFFDSASTEFDKLLKGGWHPKSSAELEAKMKEVFGKYGYDISSMSDLDRVTNEDRMFTLHQCALMPYINEYTFDILPDSINPFNGFALPFYALQCNTGFTEGELESLLRKRARTLPTNGAKFVLSNEETGQLVFNEVLLKEVCYGDSIVMLYKASTICGEISGHYNTRTGRFFSIFHEAKDLTTYQRLKAFILYLYATQVCRKGLELLSKLNERFWYDTEEKPSENLRIDIPVQVYGRGGRLRNEYRPEESRSLTGARKGNDKYTEETREIAGHVRKLGEGRHASQEAIERAEALGFDLMPDETYVQGFMRSVLKLKKRPE